MGAIRVCSLAAPGAAFPRFLIGQRSVTNGCSCRNVCSYPTVYGCWRSCPLAA